MGVSAAINDVETDFGHNLSVSSAGAVGWMQIDPGTWSQYDVAADPAKPGAAPDPYDPWDAIFTAANYLHASGAPGDWDSYLAYTYGHAGVEALRDLTPKLRATLGGHRPWVPESIRRLGWSPASRASSSRGTAPSRWRARTSPTDTPPMR